MNDIINKRICNIINNDTFNFTIDYLKYIHRYIFDGIYFNNGEFRNYNINKKEDILNGNTVLYDDYHTIDINLRYAFDNYKKRNDLVNFIIDVWVIHPFIDGNTRTICIFLYKYLTCICNYSIDYKIISNNFRFIRNALVMASYGDISAISLFISKLLDDDNDIILENNLLKNNCIYQNVRKRTLINIFKRRGNNG